MSEYYNAAQRGETVDESLTPRQSQHRVLATYLGSLTWVATGSFDSVWKYSQWSSIVTHTTETIDDDTDKWLTAGQLEQAVGEAEATRAIDERWYETKDFKSKTGARIVSACTLVVFMM